MTPKNKMASADYRGVPTARLSTKDGSYTVAAIQARQRAKNKGDAVRSQNLQSVLLPQASNRWMMPALSWVTPEYIQRILSASLMGGRPAEEQALYEMMMQTWPRLVKNVSELKNAVCGLDWVVQSDESTTQRMTGLASRCRDGMKGDYRFDGKGWRGTIHGLLDGWFCGVAVREIDWEVRGALSAGYATLPRQTRRIPAEYYGWDSVSGIFGLYLPGSNEISDIPECKFLVGMNNSSFGHPSGGALLRSLAWYWCAANFSADWLLSFAQLFGQPIRWGTYDATQPEMKALMEEMLENMGSATWAAVPAGANLELKEPAKTGSDNPQKQLIEIADTACDLLVLGQTLTSDVGSSGSRALGEVHFNVRSDIIDAAADWVAEVLNEQLLTSVAALNGIQGNEDSKLPWYEPGAKTVHDPKSNAERIKLILEAGIPLSKAYVYEQLQAPVPGDGDELFETAKTTQDNIYPKTLALGQAINSGIEVDTDWAMAWLGIPKPAPGAELLKPLKQTSDVVAKSSSLLAKALDSMPVHAREYVIDAIAKEAKNE